MYNYYKEVYNDLSNFLFDNYNKEELKEFTEDQIVDEVYDEDMVTGNGPYGYDYEEVISNYVRDNLLDALRCANEYGMTLGDLANKETNKELFQTLDTVMRCNVLYECASDFLNNLNDETEEV